LAHGRGKLSSNGHGTSDRLGVLARLAVVVVPAEREPAKVIPCDVGVLMVIHQAT
jgi:hypothetical protein